MYERLSATGPGALTDAAPAPERRIQTRGLTTSLTTTEPLGGLWYNFWYSVMMASFTLGWSFRFDGRRNIPRTGPVLLIANHESYIDPLLVGLASPRRLWYLARKTAFKGILGWYLPTVNTIPVDQEGVAKEGLRAVVDLLQQGKPVLIFPEGERAMTGVMNPFRPGIHLIIRKTLPPIVPVGVAGAYEALPRWRHFPHLSPLFLPPGRGTLAVSIGKPIDGTRYRDMPRPQVLAELFAAVKQVQERAERLRRK